MSKIYGYVTADAVRFGESGDVDDYEERYGWIDPDWSMTMLHDSRNDVRPIVDCDGDDPELIDRIAEAIEGFGHVDHHELRKGLLCV